MMLERYIDDTFQMLPIPFVYVGRDGTIAEADRAFLELSGFSSSDLVDRTAIELCAEPVGDAIPHRVPCRQIHDQTLAIGPTTERECLMRSKSGRTTPVSLMPYA